MDSRLLSLVAGTILLVVAGSVTALSSISANSESSLGGKLSGDVLTRAEWSSILSEARQSVFRVEVQDCRGRLIGSGTGFLLDEGVVTNRHVIDEAGLVKLTTDQGTEILALSWTMSNQRDLAIIQIGTVSNKKLTLNPKNPSPGAVIATVGHPLGGELSIRDGRIYKTFKGEDYDLEGQLFAMTAEALAGDSGGPVISSHGKVVGVTTYLLYKDNLSVSIPVEDLHAFLKEVDGLTKTKPCSQN